MPLHPLTCRCHALGTTPSSRLTAGVPRSSGDGSPRFLIVDPSVMQHLQQTKGLTRLFINPKRPSAGLKHMRNPFHSEAIVFPCHVNGNHWVLLVCHSRKKRVVVIDSFPGTDADLKRRFWPSLYDKCIRPLQILLLQLQTEKGLPPSGEIFDLIGEEGDWTFEVTRRATLQTDGHSCGLHMATNARDIVVRGRVLSPRFVGYT
jgi:hypothetical protein